MSQNACILLTVCVNIARTDVPYWVKPFGLVFFLYPFEFVPRLKYMLQGFRKPIFSLEFTNEVLPFFVFIGSKYMQNVYWKNNYILWE